MLPIAAPAILGAALFSFITAWNEYIITAIRFPQVPLFALPPGSEISLWNTSARWEFYAAGAFCVAVVIILFSILGALLFRTGTRGQ
jgi:arabinogalactan oligomer/maltooligosaccharide transport system permease protein